MELPTYTNIWKIEKRLYKLYDFRLPMPLPIGQVAAFLAIAVPYMLILAMVGMPFSHTWVWLYVLPPGVLTWLVTRPVIEGKRLPELVLSQVRYLSEPRTWCRLAPFDEADQVVVVARVWRQSAGQATARGTLIAMASAEDDSSVGAPRKFTPLRLRPEVARERVAPIGYADSGSGGPGKGLPRRRRGRVTPVPPPADYVLPDAPAPGVPPVAASAEDMVTPERAPQETAIVGVAGTLSAHDGPADGAKADGTEADGTEADGTEAESELAVAAECAVPDRSASDVPEIRAAPEAQASANSRIRVRDAARGQARATRASLARQQAAAGSAATADEIAEDPAPAFRPVWPSRPAMSSRAVAIARAGLDAADAVEVAAPAPAVPGPAESAVRTPAESAVPAPAGREAGGPAPAVADAVVPALAPEEAAACVSVLADAVVPDLMLADASPGSAEPASQAEAVSESPESLLPRPVQTPERPAATTLQPAAPAPRRAVTIQTAAGALEPLHVVERALRTSAPGAAGWHDRVVVVPGGHRPGKPDQVQRDQARARLPLGAPARIAVIGCTAGAGQTVTTLLAGQLMATLRAEPVAVLDLGEDDHGLTELARQVPRLVPSRAHRHWQTRTEQSRTEEPPAEQLPERGLQVVTADGRAEESDAAAVIQTVAACYPLMLTDPAARFVPRTVQVADQLVLVAPAGANAAGALAMTLEWLDSHGSDELARAAVVVLNGVSAHTEPQVAKAAAVAAGRCRAVLRVPWDTAHAGGGALSVASLQAYTALAGVLIAGLSGRGVPAETGMQGDAR